jgi:hypothetical protein
LIKCYNSEELLEIFNYTKQTISKDEFIELSPSLIYMAVNDECLNGEHDHNHHHPDGKKCISKGESKCIKGSNLLLILYRKFIFFKFIAYLFGSLSIFTIWLISFLAILIVGKFHKNASYLILSLRGLAVGTLISDSLLHIIPSVRRFYKMCQNQIKVLIFNFKKGLRSSFAFGWWS